MAKLTDKQKAGLALGRGHFKGKKLPLELKKKLSKAKLGLRGKDTNNWRGGTSRSYKDGYYSPEYKEWRKKVFERDDFICRECGKAEYITAHHIKSFSKYPKIRYDVDNGLTLCEDCHAKTDNYKGRAMKKGRRVK